jgi:hypothetical protein
LTSAAFHGCCIIEHHLTILHTNTGYVAEIDEKGEEKWPRGDEKVWKAGLRGIDSG